jgi:uncharacterized protein YrrD
MTRLVRAAELIGAPVITLDEGAVIGEVRDVLFDPQRVRFLGFTLRGVGLLSPPLIGLLPAAGIRSVGRDAVMVGSDAVVVRDEDDLHSTLGEHQDAVGQTVVTDSGAAIGRIADLVLEIDAGRAAVVGCAVRRPDGREMVVPLADELGLSWGEPIVVPAGASEHVASGLTGLREALDRARALKATAAQP